MLRTLGRRPTLVAVLAILVVAIVVYALWIPVTRADGSRLAALVRSAPPQGLDLKPPTSRTIAASEYPFAEARAAAKSAPHETGVVSVEWQPKAKNGAGAEVLLTLLPSEADAAKVRAEAISSYVSTKALKSNSYTLKKRFTVKGVPGVAGVSFATSGSGKSTVDEVVFQVDRAVEVAFMEGVGSRGVAQVSSFAQSQHGRLDQEVPGFSLATTSLPPGASFVYWVVTLAVVLVAVSVPPTIRRIRRRRRLTRAEARRRERSARGRKVLKQQTRSRAAGGAPSRRR